MVLLFAGVLPAARLERSISTSRQFIVFGGDPTLRGAVSDASERVKSNLLTLLRLPDHWSVPILLYLQRPQANVPEIPPVALNFSQTGAGLKIQLDLLLERNFESAILEREVLRALLLEMGYRALPSLPAGAPYIAPPDWLVDGILTLKNETPDVFDGLDSIAPHPPPLGNLLAQHPGVLDSQSRTLYRACASALVRILIEHDNGPAQLARYIIDLPRASADPISDLQAHFPWLGSDLTAIEKNWSENIARVAREERFILLAFSATSQQLDECLQTKIAKDREEKNSLTLEETVRATRPKIDVKIAGDLGQRLTLLATRAHPLLRAVVIDYQMAAQLVARKKMHGLGKRLAASVALRTQVGARMREVDDFMNWFEATQAKTSSGTFHDYVHAADSRDTVPRRRDALSVYLDAMETQFQ